MKAKKLLLSTIIATQVLTASALAAPDEAIKEFKKVEPIKQEVKHFQGEVKLFIVKDGEKVRVDQKMTDGLRVVNGRTCVGVRDLVNAIEGAKVEWDGTNHIVDITYAGKTISYPVGKPLMWADGKAVTIDVPAQIDPAISKTFLPIRNIAETLGFKVDWDNKAKEVVLTPGAAQTQTTTAQQPRPTTQTPQNSKTKITLASGEVIDFNNPVLDKTEYDQGKVHAKYHTYYLSDKDFIDNGDGTLTFAKGTKYEQDILKQFKLVSSAPANPNFKIWGENKNDSRVGTHMLGDGSEYFERAWQERTSKKKKELYTSVFGGPYVGTEKPILRTAISMDRGFFLTKNDQNILSTIFKDRQISQERINEFLNNVKAQGEASKLNLDKYKNKKFYDATGIIDMPLLCVGSNNPKFNRYVASSTYLTTDGRLFFSSDEIKAGQDIIIDKVLLELSYAPDNYLKSIFIVDIPNIKIKPNYDFYSDYKGIRPFLTPKSFSWRKLNI